MADKQTTQQPVAAVEAGQAPASTERHQAETDKQLTGEQKSNREAAKYRVQRNEALAKLEALEAKQREIDAKNLAAQGEYKALAEQRAEQIESIRSDHVKQTARMRDRLLRARIASTLNANGITDEDRQRMLMPGIIAEAKVEWSDDHEMTGDINSVIAKTAAAFVAKVSDDAPKEKAQDPRMHPAAALLSHQLPGSASPQNGGTLTDRFNAAMRERVFNKG